MYPLQDEAPDLDAQVRAVARRIEVATAMLITAGAGMSADGGIPTYRDEGGLYVKLDPMRTPGLTGYSFRANPEASWDTYRQMIALFRSQPPHAGYRLLLERASRMPHGWFVYTSNVDEHFQRAGFDPDRIVECHGTLSLSQCHWPCSEELFATPDSPGVPRCLRCGEMARPNVLLFSDFAWTATRMNAQHDAMDRWLHGLPAEALLVVVEIGAGTVVRSVRILGEHMARRHNGAFIRINKSEPECELGTCLQMGALEALQRLF